MTSHLPADVARCAGYVSSDFGELRENCEDCRRRTAQPAQEDNSTDPLYEQAIAIVRQYRRGSISAVQRKLAIGYNRAAAMLEAMERDGIVTPWGPGGSGRDYVPEGQRVPRMTPPPVIVFECQSYVPDGSAEA